MKVRNPNLRPPLMDYVTFTLIVDDIVWPDGHTAMACLGGGGPQTAFAIRLWTDQASEVGLAAGVGEDLPQSCKVRDHQLRRTFGLRVDALRVVVVALIRVARKDTLH